MKRTNCYIFIIFGFVLAFGCAKTETNTIPVQGAYSAFGVYTVPHPEPFQSEAFTTPVDSAFYFKNLSDSGNDITYHWDFGDGNTSAEREPVHRYAARGTYRVTLATRVRDEPSDTATAVVRVVVGQTNFSFDDNTDFRAVDVQQLADGNFVLLGASRYIPTPEAPERYFIKYLDDYHRELATHDLPVDHNYLGLVVTSDGELLLWAGDIDGVRSNTLVSTDATGQLQWSKTFEAIEQVHGVTTTADGGFIISASRLSLNIHDVMAPRSYLVKANLNGEVEWDYHFTGQEALYGTSAVSEESDGYLMAGADVDDYHPTCSSCTSLSLIKLNKSGTVLWRRRAPWGGASSGDKAWAYAMADGRHLVASYRGLYFFSAEGVFIDRRLMPSPAQSVVVTRSGGIVAASGEGDNGFRTVTYGFDSFGATRWKGGISGTVFGPDGSSSCCANSYAVKVIPLRQGGVLTVANRIDMTNNAFGYRTVGVLLEFDEQGGIQ